MSHLEDGTLQAFLDDELPPGDRARVAEHLLACERCRADHQGLSRANAAFGEAVSLLDVEPPMASGPRFADRARAGAGSFVKAAGLILALAAAASAAVPGSPVHQWIARAVETDAGPEAVPPSAATPESEPAPATAEPAPPSGVAVSPEAGPVTVSLVDLRDARIRLTGGSGAASVRVLGATDDPVFRTGRARIQVANGAGGTVEVTLPLSAEGSRLEVDGETYAEVAEGRLVVRVPADTADGAVTWR